MKEECGTCQRPYAPQVLAQLQVEARELSQLPDALQPSLCDALQPLQVQRAQVGEPCRVLSSQPAAAHTAAAGQETLSPARCCMPASETAATPLRSRLSRLRWCAICCSPWSVTCRQAEVSKVQHDCGICTAASTTHAPRCRRRGTGGAGQSRAPRPATRP